MLNGYHKIVQRGTRMFEIIRVRGGQGGSYRLNIYRSTDQKWHTIDTLRTRAEAMATIRQYINRYPATRRRAA